MASLLIIDDDRTDRLLMRKALLQRASGLEVIELAGGQGAVHFIRLQKPSATILDIRMPGLDGFDVLRQIRNQRDLEDHPVFMMSGSEEPRDRDMARDAGANACLTKPVSLRKYRELANTICEWVFGPAPFSTR